MRIAWYSNAPGPTGYGTQTAQVCSRLKADGHEVSILANYGQQIGMGAWNGIPVFPQGVIQYGIDVLDDQADMAGAELVITLYDVWVLPPTLWQGKRVLSWTPIDHFPATPEVMRWAKTHETIAMSTFGADTLRMGGVEPIATIPHGIEDVFRPTPSDARERMKVPEDAFLIGINAANIGTTPPRKAWGSNLEAVARMIRRHDDVYLYLHSDLVRPGGMPLTVLITALGIPKEKVIVVPPALYRGAFISDEELARLYSAMDVHLLCSKGEGFGLPVAESMACGVPNIVSDFSAQPELVGDTGWKVPGQLDWDHNQGSWFFTPFTHAILEALEESYQERGTDKAQERREAAAAHVEQYHADRVYRDLWRPLIERVDAELHPVARKGNTNAAKRRARKAKAA